MQMQFFQIPAVGGEGIVEEVNCFLRTHRVLQLRMGKCAVVAWRFASKRGGLNRLGRRCFW